MLTLIAARTGAMQEVLSFFLSSVVGVQIAGTASDALSTLELVKAHRPALVIIDGNLPENNVSDLVRQIKAGQPKTKIIVLANGTWQEQEFMTVGADAVLHRGVALTKITDVITQLTYSSQVTSYSGKGV